MDLMTLIQQKKAAMNSGNRQKTAKPPEGRSKWRILPGWRKDKEDSTFFHDFGQHFIKGMDNQLKAVYVCVDKTYGKPCKICEAIRQGVMSSSDDDVVKVLKDANAASRILLNAIHVDGESQDPQILEVGPKVFSEIINIIQEWGNILDLDTGKDIVIERTGKGLNTKYSVQVAAKSAPVPASVMGKLHDLDEYVAQESEEQARRALANLSQVAGLLPSAAASKPALSAVFDDDPDVTLEIPDGKPAKPTKEVKSEPESTGDAELDDLLASL